MKQESIEFWPRVFYVHSLLFDVISFFRVYVDILHEKL